MDQEAVPVVTLSRRRVAVGATAAVCALVVGYLGAKLVFPGAKSLPQQQQHQSRAPSAQTAPSTPSVGTSGGSGAALGAPPATAPLTAFADRVGGFRVSYPRGWRRLSSKDAGVRLLLAGPSGSSLLVRRATLGVSVTGRSLDTLELATGRLLKAEKGLTIISGPKLLSVHSLPGYLYIYTYADPVSHATAAHSQIVLFDGTRMYTLIFQAAPASALAGLAPLFDQVTDTFRAT